MMSSALWYTYSALHFTGWPTPSNYDAIGGRGHAYLDELKVETTIRQTNEGAGVLVGAHAGSRPRVLQLREDKVEGQRKAGE
jgi:hypothetical protein